jgi:hypothetical protein
MGPKPLARRPFDRSPTLGSGRKRCGRIREHQEDRERPMNDTVPADANDDVEALRQENEALRQQLAAESAPGAAAAPRGPLWRRIVAWVLAVLAVIAILAAVDAVWLKTFVTEREAFVETLEPLPQDEAVATAISVRVADGIVEVTGIEAFVAETLPDQISFLSAPLTAGITDFTSKAAFEVVTSDAVATAWSGALGVTHTAVSAVLTGNDGALIAEGGQIAIDLDEVGAIVVDRVEAAGVTLPDAEVELGRIVILESEQLAAAQSVAQWINTVGWFLPLLALLLAAGAVFAAPNRRYMIGVLGFATGFALLISLALLRIARNALFGGIEDEIRAEAAGAVWDIVLGRLVQGTWALLILAFIVGFIAWAVGPTPRAESLRAWSARTIDGWRRPGESEPSGFTAFMKEWRRTIQVVVVVLGVLFLLFGPAPSGLLVLFTAAVVLILVVVAEVLGGPEQTTVAPTAKVDATAPGDD